MATKTGYAFFSDAHTSYLRVYKIRTTGEVFVRKNANNVKQELVPCEIIEQIFNYSYLSNNTFNLFSPGALVKVLNNTIAYSPEQYDKLFSISKNIIQKSLDNSLIRIAAEKEFMLQKLKDNKENFSSTEKLKTVIEALVTPSVKF